MLTISLQLDDKEFACSAAVKAKKSMELEIEDLQQQLDDISKAKTEVIYSQLIYIVILFYSLFFSSFFSKGEGG